MDDSYTHSVTADEIVFTMVPHYLMDLLERGHITSTDYVVWCRLAQYADNKTNQCFPKQQTLADKLQVSKSTVERSLKRLQEVGAIDVTPQRRTDGSKRGNLYTVYRNFPCQPIKRDHEYRSSPTTSTGRHPRRVQVVTGDEAITRTNITKPIRTKKDITDEENKFPHESDQEIDDEKQVAAETKKVCPSSVQPKRELHVALVDECGEPADNEDLRRYQTATKRLYDAGLRAEHVALIAAHCYENGAEQVTAMQLANARHDGQWFAEKPLDGAESHAEQVSAPMHHKGHSRTSQRRTDAYGNPVDYADIFWIWEQ